MIRIELSLRLANSPGALAGVCRLLSAERVNVQAVGQAQRQFNSNHVRQSIRRGWGLGLEAGGWPTRLKTDD